MRVGQIPHVNFFDKQKISFIFTFVKQVNDSTGETCNCFLTVKSFSGYK